MGKIFLAGRGSAIVGGVDGVLVGETNGSDKKVSANTFLIWKGGEVGDFDFKMTGAVTGGNNSGVQYRSKVLDKAKSSVGGYQMDMHPKQEYLGMLFEERGRGIQCLRGEKVGWRRARRKAKVTGKASRAGSGSCEIQHLRDLGAGKQGHALHQWPAGHRDCGQRSGKAFAEGVLALQLHAGAPMKLEVKDIVLRTIESKAAALGRKRRGSSLPGSGDQGLPPPRKQSTCASPSNWRRTIRRPRSP